MMRRQHNGADPRLTAESPMILGSGLPVRIHRIPCCSSGPTGVVATHGTSIVKCQRTSGVLVLRTYGIVPCAADKEEGPTSNLHDGSEHGRGTDR